MRLDLFLKNSGLIPRRSVAQRACEAGLVELNGRPAKAATKVAVGDRITLRIGTRVTQHEVLDVPLRAVARGARPEYVKLLYTEPAYPEL